MIAVVLQPSYVPWRGFFDLIHRADVFVFYDDVQYDKHGWRNRNKVKGANPGGDWITIPVLSKGNVQGVPINEIRIAWERPWAQKHWGTLRQVYGKAPYFKHYAPLIEPFYARRDELLADFTIELTMAIARELGIKHTQFLRSSEMSLEGSKTDRLLGLLQKVGAKRYISGPSAKAYIEPEKFERAGIALEYISYDYKPYPQLREPFDPNLSILDLLFMTGPAAKDQIWG